MLLLMSLWFDMLCYKNWSLLIIVSVCQTVWITSNIVSLFSIALSLTGFSITLFTLPTRTRQACFSFNEINAYFQICLNKSFIMQHFMSAQF